MSPLNIVRCNIPADWSSNFSQCLYDWQGLEGAALALLAAVVGVIFVQRQIKQAQTHRADEIARRHNAARLTLPLALAAVSELTQRIANEVGDEFESFSSEGTRTIEAILEEDGERRRFDARSLPSEVLSSFEDFVASLDQGRDLRHVAELVASIQILLSRFNDFDLKQAGAQYGLSGLLLDAAKVKLMNDKIYNYARFVDDSSFGIVGVVKPAAAWDEIHGKAHSLVFHRKSPDVFLPDLEQQINSYKERNVSPWNEKFFA